MKVRDQKGWAIEVDEYQKVADAIDNLAKASAEQDKKQYDALILLANKLFEINKEGSDKIAAAIEANTNAMLSIAESIKEIASKEGMELYNEDLFMLSKHIQSNKPPVVTPPTYEFAITRDRNGYLSGISAKPKN